MNFIDPKELDIPNHGTKNRYKTILPSKYSKKLLISYFLLNQEAVLLSGRGLRSKVNNPKERYYGISLFPEHTNIHSNNTLPSEHSLFSHCQPTTEAD